MAVQPAESSAVSPTVGVHTVPSPAKKMATPLAAAAAVSRSPPVSFGSFSEKKTGKVRSSSNASVNSRKANPEKRANHNAIERARRESLNNRFLILAASLPAISQIRRPSKSLIVNRSLQFVADSLSLEMLYRDMLKEMHARNINLIREVNNLRARCGLTTERGVEAETELFLPKGLTEVEKAACSRHPMSNTDARTDGANSNDSLSDSNLNGAEFLDDLDDFDDCGSFPLPADGLDGFGLSRPSANGMAAYSPLSSIDDGSTDKQGIPGSAFMLNHPQFAAAAAAAGASGFVTLSHVTTSNGGPVGMPGSTTPNTSSPPELSSSMSSSGVESTTSPTSTANHTSPAMPTPTAAAENLPAALPSTGLFDIAPPFPVMTSPVATLAAHRQYQYQYQQPQPQQQPQFHIHPGQQHAHVRAATFPQQQQQQHGVMPPHMQHPQSHPHANAQQQSAPVSTTPTTPTFDIAAYMFSLQAQGRQHISQQQQLSPEQHSQAQAQAFAAAAFAAQRHQQQQPSHSELSINTSSAQHLRSSPWSGHQHNPSAPLPLSFRAAPSAGFMAAV